MFKKVFVSVEKEKASDGLTCKFRYQIESGHAVLLQYAMGGGGNENGERDGP